MQIIKYNEKVLIWLHREKKSNSWLAEHLSQTKQSIGQKLKSNSFTDSDKRLIKGLGFEE